MKAKLFVPAMFLIVTIFLVLIGAQFVENWKSFLIGALFALSARDIGKELIKRV